MRTRHFMIASSGTVMWLLSIALSVAAHASRRFAVHNPHGVDVHTVHLVQSAHLDIGCKTFGCSQHLIDGEPDRCLAGHVEPFAYHIVNRWFDEFLLRGAAFANASRAAAGTGADRGVGNVNSTDRYRHMVHPWIVSTFFDCPRAARATRSWAGSGWRTNGTESAAVLHCPNATTLAAVRFALQRGDLHFHAFPHNGQTAAFPADGGSLFDAALAMAPALAAQLGVATPTTVSVRDVPGWSRAALPRLVRRNVSGLSFGAGQPPGKPDTPPLFVWRDEASAAEVVVTYESGYGSATSSGRANATAFVLPSGVAMAAAWAGDNTGPPSPDVAAADFASLRALFPAATVIASTFDAFFAEANKPEVKALLPVVTAEIGDGWVYGVPSDPLKNALLREAGRQREQCVRHGACDPASPAMRAFDRQLIKATEHTWGVASQIFMPDYANWSNARFDTARFAQQPTGFKNDTSLAAGADFNTTVNSWLEQRLYITDAPRLLRPAYPALASSLDSAFSRLRSPLPPGPGPGPGPGPEPLLSSPHVRLRQVARPASATFTCGGHTVAFDGRGAVTTLVTADGTAWASPAQPLGLFQYATFDNEDYNGFLADFAARVDGPGCGGYRPGHSDDTNCKNFRKPNVTLGGSPRRRVVRPQGAEVWHGSNNGSSSCTFVVRASLAAEAHDMAGAPARIAMTVLVEAGGVSWEIYQIDKRATRLPEATFFSFVPSHAATAPLGWRVHNMGVQINPADVIGAGDAAAAAAAGGAVYGGSPHLRGADAVSWSPVRHEHGAAGGAGQLGMVLSSLDVPVVSLGAATPFPSPRTAPPNMSQGVHFNIQNNIWNTNYVLWYPFVPEDSIICSRFQLNFTS